MMIHRSAFWSNVRSNESPCHPSGFGLGYEAVEAEANKRAIADAAIDPVGGGIFHVGE